MTSKTLTLDELDLLLADWQAKYAAASASVIELMDIPTYKMLTGKGGFVAPKLSGETDLRCTPALKALGELWGLFVEMGKVLTEAKAKRDALKSRPKAEQLLEIQELLTGQSIKFTVKLPFAERSLLSPTEVATGMTLERVMESMVKAYDQGKAVVLEVEQAVTRLHGSLQSSVLEVQALRLTAQELGEGGLPELDLVAATVKAADDLIFNDPLGVKAGFETEIEPMLKRARERINGLKELYEQIKRDIALARTTMTSLGETHRKAKEALAERELKIWLADGDSLPRPPDDSAVLALGEWLGRLESGLALGKWKPLRMGVANWSIQATERMLACQVASTANLEPLNKRQELRSYLDALKAKAQTYGRSEDEELAAIEKAARALLYTRPTRLVEAEKLVAEYAASLR